MKEYDEVVLQSKSGIQMKVYEQVVMDQQEDVHDFNICFNKRNKLVVEIST